MLEQTFKYMDKETFVDRFT